MGLLDDAIREHLELKRLHGADAAEIARQEREALGPVVRGELTIPDTGRSATLLYDDDGPDAPEAEAPELEPADLLDDVHAAETRLHAPAEPAAPAPATSEGAAAAAAAAPSAPDAGQPTVAFSLDDLEAAGSAPPPAAAEERPRADAGAAAPLVPPGPAADAPAPPAASPPPAAASPTPPIPLDEPVQELSWDDPASGAPAHANEIAEDVVPADAGPDEHDELEETPEFLQETPEHDRLWFEQRPPRDFDF